MIDLHDHERNEAEQAVIGSMIIDQRVISKLAAILTPDDFISAVHKTLFEVAVDIEERGKAFDHVIAIDIAKTKLDAKAAQYVAELVQMTATSANCMEYAKIVKKHSGLRQIRDAVEDALTGDDPQAMAGDIIGLCQDFLQGSRTKRVKTLADALKSMYDEKSNKNALRIDTGLSKLDWLLKGMCAGNLIIIAARPGVGKSAIGLQIARHAAMKGNKTALFTMEMTDDEVAERLVSRSGVDMDKLIDNNLTEEDWKTLNQSAVNLSKLPLMIIDDPNMTVSKVRATVRSEPDIKLIVADYLTLFKGTKKREKRYIEIGDITRELKILASELRIPIVVLCQLNRENDETTEPQLGNLRESGDIEQDANKVIMLWKLNLPVDREPQRIGCKVAKNRRGKTGTVVMMFDGAHMTFTELEERYTPPKKSNKVFD